VFGEIPGRWSDERAWRPAGAGRIGDRIAERDRVLARARLPAGDHIAKRSGAVLERTAGEQPNGSPPEPDAAPRSVLRYKVLITSPRAKVLRAALQTADESNNWARRSRRLIDHKKTETKSKATVK